MKLFSSPCKRVFVLCHILFFVCNIQIISVKLRSQHYFNVSISNGVKEGSIVSSVLFTIYIDVLFTMFNDLWFWLLYWY